MKDCRSHEDETLTTIELYNKYHKVVYDTYNKYFKYEWLKDDLVVCGEYGLYKGVREYVKNPKGKALNFLYTYILNEMGNEWESHVGKKDSYKRKGISKTTSSNQKVEANDGGYIELEEILPSNKTDWNAITEWIDVKTRISTLDEEEKKLLGYVISGYRHHEIAKILGISRGYASKKIGVLRRKLGGFQGDIKGFNK